MTDRKRPKQRETWTDPTVSTAVEQRCHRNTVRQFEMHMKILQYMRHSGNIEYIFISSLTYEDEYYVENDWDKFFKNGFFY